MSEPKKKRGGNNNPTGKGGFSGKDDPRRNNNGQRKAEVVRTASEYRDYLVQVMHEKAGAPPPDDATYLQVMAFRHVRDAANGDADEREKLLDRIWGKSTQPIKHEFDDLPDDELIKRAASLTAGVAAMLGSVAGDAAKTRDS